MTFTLVPETYKHYHISYVIYSSGKTECTVASSTKIHRYGSFIYEPIYNFTMKSFESAKRHAHSLIDSYIKNYDLPESKQKFIE